MNPRKTVVFVPGKLFISGEYAVVLGHSPAILASLNRGITCTVQDADSFSFYSKKLSEDVKFSSFLHFDLPNDTRIKPIFRLLDSYFQEHNIQYSPVSITIESDLDDATGRKFGFGSSGALTVALLRALLEHIGIHLSALQLYKLAVLASRSISLDSSFGDLACSCLRGWVFYDKFDDHWLDQHMHLSLSDLLTLPWKDLELVSLPHLKVPYLIVYTGIPAISSLLVKAVLAHRQKPRFKQFSNHMSEAVNWVRHGLELPHTETFFTGLRMSQSALDDLELLSEQRFKIPEMQTIASIVWRSNGTMKVSGAGGGDCVLCFFNSDSDKERAKTKIDMLGFMSFSKIFEEGLH